MVAPIDEKLSDSKLEMIWLYQKRAINIPMKNSKLIQVNGTKKMDKNKE